MGAKTQVSKHTGFLLELIQLPCWHCCEPDAYKDGDGSVAARSGLMISCGFHMQAVVEHGPTSLHTSIRILTVDSYIFVMSWYPYSNNHGNQSYHAEWLSGLIMVYVDITNAYDSNINYQCLMFNAYVCLCCYRRTGWCSHKTSCNDSPVIPVPALFECTLPCHRSTTASRNACTLGAAPNRASLMPAILLSINQAIQIWRIDVVR